MGKRQTRIFPQSFLQQLPMLVNQEANILLKNGTVFHGIIKPHIDSSIHLTDMLGRKHTINLDIIAEIILDKESLY